ncbi:hypothetical protein FRC07_008569, partial [Ceratobasidium sp. 392]
MGRGNATSVFTNHTSTPPPPTPVVMNACFDDTGLIQQLQSLKPQLLTAIATGVDACAGFSAHLESTLTHAQQLISTGRASPQLARVLSTIAYPLDKICSTFEYLAQEKIQYEARLDDAFRTIFSTVNRRRRK